MPIYEYRCPVCGHEVEVLQRLSDPPPKCEECEEEPVMEKQVSATSFSLKGGGWASDGYSH